MQKFLLTIIALAVCLVAGAQNADKLYKEGKKLYDDKNYTAAFHKLKPAAEKGHKKAQYRLGRCYAKGHGVAENDAVAVQWYAKSAAQGYGKAQYRLGKCYLKGNGVAADQSKAREWLLKAVKNDKHGDEILSELRKDAASGDEEAKAILKLIKK
jgi:hypothetical protein